MAGALAPDVEGILCADLDLGMISPAKAAADAGAGVELIVGRRAGRPRGRRRAERALGE